MTVPVELSTTLIGAWLCACAIAGWIWLTQTATRKLPPGPRGLPFLGNLFLLGKHPSVTLQQWKKQFGSILTVYEQKGPTIFINDLETARKVYANDAITFRPVGPARADTSELPSGSGLFHSNGELWRTHRRFALSSLRDLAINGNWLEDAILDEVEEFCAWLKTFDGKPVNPKPKLSMIASNVVSAFLFGRTFAWSDTRFQRFSGCISENVATLGLVPIIQTFPFLMRFPNPIRTKMLKFHQNRHDLSAFMKEFLADADREQDLHHDDVKDYIHAYRHERETGAKTSAQHLFDDSQLISSMLDMFSAGTETTASSIVWTFIFLLENPEVQRKIHDEIDGNAGRDKLVRNSDRVKLPYTEATTLEVQRLACLVPGIGSHTAEEVEIAGYKIPKFTSVELSTYALHRDEKLWENPEKFDPARFLDDEGRIKKRDGYAPFGIGKRDCLGQVLARTELFLVTANILRCYSIKVPAGKTVTRNDYVASSLDFHIPAPVDLIFVPRDSAKHSE